MKNSTLIHIPLITRKGQTDMMGGGLPFYRKTPLLLAKKKRIKSNTDG